MYVVETPSSRSKLLYFHRHTRSRDRDAGDVAPVVCTATGHGQGHSTPAQCTGHPASWCEPGPSHDYIRVKFHRNQFIIDTRIIIKTTKNDAKLSNLIWDRSQYLTRKLSCQFPPCVILHQGDLLTFIIKIISFEMGNFPKILNPFSQNVNWTPPINLYRKTDRETCVTRVYLRIILQ